MPWEMGLRWWIFALRGVLEVVDGQEREKKGTGRRGGSGVNIYVCRQSRTTVMEDGLCAMEAADTSTAGTLP